MNHKRLLARAGDMRQVAGIQPDTCFVLGRESEERSERMVHPDAGSGTSRGECLQGQAGVTKVVTS